MNETKQIKMIADLLRAMNQTKQMTTVEKLKAGADSLQGWVDDDETMPRNVVCFMLGVAAAFRSTAQMLREESEEIST